MTDSNLSEANILRILIADDHMIVRDGLRVLIATQPDLELIGEASDGRMALEMARTLLPDIILMDLRMPHLHGTQVIHELTPEYPSIKILVMSSSEDSTDVSEAMRAGARGYLTKGAHHLEVLLAIRTVGQGGMVFGQAVVGGILNSLQAPSSVLQTSQIPARQVFPELTDREFEVLELLASDFRNPKIGARLNISEKTVRNHVSNILWKLQAKDRDEAITRAHQSGLGHGLSELARRD
jgi:DNA-binding NarL/FixJ family response regulator